MRGREVLDTSFLKPETEESS